MEHTHSRNVPAPQPDPERLLAAYEDGVAAVCLISGAELAALADAPPAEHIAAFAASARRYATRLPAVWDLPHHQYRDVVVTVSGMTGAACAEWHLHASDLATAVGIGYRPADPDVILAGWVAGMPHLPLAVPAGWLAAWHGRHADPWQAVLGASGRGASLPSAGREPGGERSCGRWSARPLLRRKG